MASHPYISGAGNIAQMIGFLRKNFPPTVTSETVKKFSLASNNESYVINALQFIGVLDADGKRTERGHGVFLSNSDEFPGAFEKLIKEAYKDLFDIRGDDAWSLSKKDLTSYFRTTDKTSEAIGSRQAAVFAVFRELAGHEQASDNSPATISKASVAKKPKASTTRKPPIIDMKSPIASNSNPIGTEGRKDLALTVRIEINLPANGSQESYDAIFKSIRANLINE